MWLLHVLAAWPRLLAAQVPEFLGGGEVPHGLPGAAGAAEGGDAAASAAGAGRSGAGAAGRAASSAA
eukprot:14055030-Alexandrium_andersonii.AAC.1